MCMMRSAVGTNHHYRRRCAGTHLENRHFTITKLTSHFPQISHSLLHKIVTEHLFRKLCTRWVPKQLTPEHEAKRMESALTFLQQYHDDGDKFLDQIITGEQTWVAHITPETKQASMHWHFCSSTMMTAMSFWTLSSQVMKHGLHTLPQQPSRNQFIGVS